MTWSRGEARGLFLRCDLLRQQGTGLRLPKGTRPVGAALALGYRLQLAGLGDEFRTTQPLVQALDFVLIDEADSVLIDEANILILTEPVDHKLSEAFVAQAIDLVARAADDVWENADTLGYRGLRPEALARLIDSLTDPAPEWQSLAVAEEMISKARLAQDKFSRDVHYDIIEDKKIVLVDAQTGRPTPDRSLPWDSAGDRVSRGAGG